MDFEKFNKWSSQFETMLDKLAEQDASLQAIRRAQFDGSHCIGNGCIAQVAVEAELRKMANSIRALGFCYENLRKAMDAEAVSVDTEVSV